MDFIFPPPPMTSIPVIGQSAQYPVRRVFCVGRNYSEHAAEMGADLREPPFFFTKPADAVIPHGGKIHYPPATSDLQHEIELVIALKQGGTNLSVAEASQCIFGYAVGIDLTRRDLQAKAKEKRHPWDMGKAFDESAPISALIEASQVANIEESTIWLEVNGQRRQQGKIGEMIWNVAEIIAHLSKLVSLTRGDLIFTGTPAGVGTINKGDTVQSGIEAVGTLSLELI